MKKLSLLILFLFLSLSLFGFGINETQSPNITIEYWTHEDVNRQKLEERYIKEFCALNPHVTVNVSYKNSEKIAGQVLNALVAGKGPTFFNLSIEDEYPLIANGYVAPMKYEMAGFSSASDVIDSYLPGILDCVTLDGEVYGLPLEINNWSIYINKGIFAQVGLDAEKDYPKTWEDMVELSKKLVIRDSNILVRRGYDFRYRYYLVNNIPMVEQLGGKLISDDGKEAIVGEEAWVKFLTFMQNWGPYKENLGSPTYAAARTLFNLDNNQVAMCSTGLYQQQRLLSDNPEFYHSDNWMVVPYPTFENAVNDVASCYYGHYFLVNSSESEEVQKAAWALIAYMLSHSEEYLTSVGILQPTVSLMNSDTYNNMPYADVFRSDFNRSHIVYYAEHSTEIQNLIKTAVESVMLLDVDPTKAYQQLKVAAQEVIDER